MADAGEQLALEVVADKVKTKEKPRREKQHNAVLVSAHVVASRVCQRRNRQITEYKIEVETKDHGTFVVWYPYKTIRHLSEALEAREGFQSSGIPTLPMRQVLPNLSKFMQMYQVIVLDQFLTAAVTADNMHWGIRLSKSMCAVKHKRREKKEPKTARPRRNVEANAASEACTSDQVPTSTRRVKVRVSDTGDHQDTRAS